MIRGKVVPFFDKEDGYFNEYEEIEIDGFLNRDNVDLYFYRSENNRSRPDLYIDILVASYYALSKKNNSTFLYSDNLTQLFFRLFPTYNDFECALSCNIIRINQSLTKLQQTEKSKVVILGITAIYQKALGKALKRLREVPKHYTDYGYIQIAIKYAKDVKIILDDFHDTIQLVPSLQFEYKYYQMFPFKSWEEQPLAFFVNVLYGNGLQDLVKEYGQELIEEHDPGDLNTFIWRTFTREYYISYRLIKSKVSTLHRRNLRQEYFKELCGHIDILYTKSSSHPIKDIAHSHLGPYKAIIRNLKRHFKTHKEINVEFNFGKEKDLYILSDTFIEDLLDLRVPNNEQQQVTLCKPEVKPLDIKHIIIGDLDAIKISKIGLQWPKETVFYLLWRLLDNNASFKITDLQKKIFFYVRDISGEIKEAPFRRTSYFPYITKLINKENRMGENRKVRQSHYDNIDALFEKATH